MALSEVEEGHDGGLLVLRWVAGEDLLDELVVLLGELEGEGGVVLGGVAVLQRIKILAIVQFLELSI